MYFEEVEYNPGTISSTNLFNLDIREDIHKQLEMGVSSIRVVNGVIRHIVVLES